MEDNLFFKVLEKKMDQMMQSNPGAREEMEIEVVKQDIPMLYAEETSRSIHKRSKEQLRVWKKGHEGSQILKLKEEAHGGAASEFSMRVVKSFRFTLSRHVGRQYGSGGGGDKAEVDKLPNIVEKTGGPKREQQKEVGGRGKRRKRKLKHKWEQEKWVRKGDTPPKEKRVNSFKVKQSSIKEIAMPIVGH